VVLARGIYLELRSNNELTKQLEQFPELLRSKGIWAIAGAIILMFLQWGLEVVKWKRMFSRSFELSWLNAFRAVFSGLAISMITPNRIGEFAGRIIYLPAKLRIKGTAFTFISNLAQLLVTLTGGCLTLLFSGSTFKALLEPAGLSAVITLLYWLAPLMTAVICLLFFTGSRWMGKLMKVRMLSRYSSQISMIDSLSIQTLLVILFWSVCRYMLFIAQYGILFTVSGEMPDVFTLSWSVAMMFLWLAIVPTLAVAELGVRWRFAYWLFTPVLVNYPVILFVVTAIWVINFILPAVIGSVIVFFYKPFGVSAK
jgi:hypothetical protein